MFRLTLVIAFLIFLIPVEKTDHDLSAEPITAAEASSALYDLYADAMSFCERKPDTCETGRYVFTQFKAKANRGLEIAAEWAKPDGEPARPDYPYDVATGSVE